MILNDILISKCNISDNYIMYVFHVYTVTYPHVLISSKNLRIVCILVNPGRMLYLYEYLINLIAIGSKYVWVLSNDEYSILSYCQVPEALYNEKNNI